MGPAPFPYFPLAQSRSPNNPPYLHPTCCAKEATNLEFQIFQPWQRFVQCIAAPVLYELRFCKKQDTLHSKPKIAVSPTTSSTTTPHTHFVPSPRTQSPLTHPAPRKHNPTLPTLPGCAHYAPCAAAPTLGALATCQALLDARGGPLGEAP